MLRWKNQIIFKYMFYNIFFDNRFHSFTNQLVQRNWAIVVKHKVIFWVTLIKELRTQILIDAGQITRGRLIITVNSQISKVKKQTKWPV